MQNFQPIDLNEKIESEEIEIPEKNVNDSHVKRSLGEETEPMECEKHDEVSKFQPQEVNEANEASTEEVKQIEEASEGCKSTERTALGHTATEEAATKELISSEKDDEELQKIYGLDSEEKLEVEDAGENIEEETQKNEEAFDTEMHKSTTKSEQFQKIIYLFFSIQSMPIVAEIIANLSSKQYKEIDHALLITNLKYIKSYQVTFCLSNITSICWKGKSTARVLFISTMIGKCK